ncbi:oxidoreductase [Segniliparus rugosus]|uniref:Probable oxidoreductase n=1 Tax=Segniliparus rugosus (strain ATCC BAA-974 / DSM 45345 / CCUG 50838 / CIP 108380 / JCM 13579 / CDC 945) TaxID=679197 RepID=E5XP89_SEGRC|nr:oxidoreductase [Segniliparus rugosus]EFV13835.1 hypothetical protein HMPREF9336_01310 [Segniliparus rugosus ATCC BAA-974]
MTTKEQRPIGSGFGAAATAGEVLDGLDLTGRAALVTGGSSGLGLETVRALSSAGARVIAPVRKADAARTALAGAADVRLVDRFDLGDLASVASAAEEIAGLVDRLDIVVAAAGVMATPSRPVGPGWDYQLSVNHLGHFALIARLYPLLAARGARVVVYSSAGHHASDIRWDDPHFLGGYDKWAAYGQSKTANILFAAQLDVFGRQDGVRAFSLHPGKIMTGLQRDIAAEELLALGWVDQDGKVLLPDLKTPSQGAATGLWAATSPALDGRGGLYLEDCDVALLAEPNGSMDDGGVRPYALDPGSAERLWRLTSAMTATDLVR